MIRLRSKTILSLGFELVRVAGGVRILLEMRFED